ncbi:MAG: hypothetical protein M0Z64_02850 [Nitrospiraceae bacterium]|nr:hypothetical protein [Nitrospiraceae bacterium]
MIENIASHSYYRCELCNWKIPRRFIRQDDTIVYAGEALAQMEKHYSVEHKDVKKERVIRYLGNAVVMDETEKRIPEFKPPTQKKRKISAHKKCSICGKAYRKEDNIIQAYDHGPRGEKIVKQLNIEELIPNVCSAKCFEKLLKRPRGKIKYPPCLRHGRIERESPNNGLMRSSYEKKFAAWLESKGIHFSYEAYWFSWRVRRKKPLDRGWKTKYWEYYMCELDFFIERSNILVEVKGFVPTESVVKYIMLGNMLPGRVLLITDKFLKLLTI